MLPVIDVYKRQVLYNAGLIHGSDYDDTHVGGIVHPSAAVVSTAICVGEAVGATGQEIYEAIIVGWEVIVRLALSAKGRFHDEMCIRDRK